MKFSEACGMIRNAEIDHTRPVVWADFGCGSGVFTKALAEILPDGSTVYGIDKTEQSIQWPEKSNMNFRFIQADFEKVNLMLPRLDGILMGNSLHYVPDKRSFLQRLIKSQPAIRTFIVIEYEISHSNPWVPYPVGFHELKKLFEESGYNNITRLGEKKSVYQRGNIYACYARKG